MMTMTERSNGRMTPPRTYSSLTPQRALSRQISNVSGDVTGSDNRSRSVSPSKLARHYSIVGGGVSDDILLNPVNVSYVNSGTVTPAGAPGMVRRQPSMRFSEGEGPSASGKGSPELVMTPMAPPEFKAKSLLNQSSNPLHEYQKLQDSKAGSNRDYMHSAGAQIVNRATSVLNSPHAKKVTADNWTKMNREKTLQQFNSKSNSKSNNSNSKDRDNSNNYDVGRTSTVHSNDFHSNRMQYQQQPEQQHPHVHEQAHQEYQEVMNASWISGNGGGDTGGANNSAELLPGTGASSSGSDGGIVGAPTAVMATNSDVSAGVVLSHDGNIGYGYGYGYAHDPQESWISNMGTQELEEHHYKLLQQQKQQQDQQQEQMPTEMNAATTATATAVHLNDHLQTVRATSGNCLRSQQQQQQQHRQQSTARPGSAVATATKSASNKTKRPASATGAGKTQQQRSLKARKHMGAVPQRLAGHNKVMYHSQLDLLMAQITISPYNVAPLAPYTQEYLKKSQDILELRALSQAIRHTHHDEGDEKLTSQQAHKLLDKAIEPPPTRGDPHEALVLAHQHTLTAARLNQLPDGTLRTQHHRLPDGSLENYGSLETGGTGTGTDRIRGTGGGGAGISTCTGTGTGTGTSLDALSASASASAHYREGSFEGLGMLSKKEKQQAMNEVASRMKDLAHGVSAHVDQVNKFHKRRASSMVQKTRSVVNNASVLGRYTQGQNQGDAVVVTDNKEGEQQQQQQQQLVLTKQELEEEQRQEYMSRSPYVNNNNTAATTTTGGSRPQSGSKPAGGNHSRPTSASATGANAGATATSEGGDGQHCQESKKIHSLESKFLGILKYNPNYDRPKMQTFRPIERKARPLADIRAAKLEQRAKDAQSAKKAAIAARKANSSMVLPRAAGKLVNGITVGTQGLQVDPNYHSSDGGDNGGHPMSLMDSLNHVRQQFSMETHDPLESPAAKQLREAEGKDLFYKEDPTGETTTAKGVQPGKSAAGVLRDSRPGENKAETKERGRKEEEPSEEEVMACLVELLACSDNTKYIIGEDGRGEWRRPPTASSHGIYGASLPDRYHNVRLTASNKYTDMTTPGHFNDHRRKGWELDAGRHVMRKRVQPHENVSRWENYKSVLKENSDSNRK